SAPLLALFWWTSLNTNIPEIPPIIDKFRSIQAVVPPSEQRMYIVQPNQNYNNGLVGLQLAVARVARQEPDAERAMRDSADSAQRVRRELAATLPPDVEAHIEQRASDLLEQPIKNLDGLGLAGLRSGGASFCSAFTPLTRKFPFNRDAREEVSL